MEMDELADHEMTKEELSRIVTGAELISKRRIRICKQAPKCPKCKANQVQIIDSGLLAKWKCRECKHKWTYEPLVEIN